MAARRIIVTDDTIQRIKAKVSEMPPKKETTPTSTSAKAAITRLRREITAMRQRGYTYDDIVTFLAREGIQISKATLRTYVQQFNKTKRSRSRKTAKPVPPTPPAPTPPAPTTAAPPPPKQVTPTKVPPVPPTTKVPPVPPPLAPRPPRPLQKIILPDDIIPQKSK